VFFVDVAAQQAHEADNAIESRLEAIFIFERFVPSLVSLRQPHSIISIVNSRMA
jgi:hypothetical protein